MGGRCCVGELADKQVINVCDGKCLGYVCDVEVSVCDGKLTAIFVPGESKTFTLSRGDDMRIPWEKIERIGDDTILVNVGDTVCRVEECPQTKRKKRGFFG